MPPIGQGDRFVGMVTDCDIALRLVAEGSDPAPTKVHEVMTAELRYVYKDDDLAHVANAMVEQQVRRLPVRSRSRRLTDVVSLPNIAREGE